MIEEDFVQQFHLSLLECAHRPGVLRAKNFTALGVFAVNLAISRRFCGDQ
jgi:hypothetical protein